LQFSSLITDEAEILIQSIAKELSLKTLDSLQFAFFKVYCEKDTIFVCSDSKLCNIVQKEGYKIFKLVPFGRTCGRIHLNPVHPVNPVKKIRQDNRIKQDIILPC
jgi:hypothetical protein